MPQTAVLIRLDKIGDLVCSLPVDQRPELKDWDIQWVLSQGLEAIAQNAVPARNFLALRKTSQDPFWKLLLWLKVLKPQVVVVFYAPWWVSLACFLARIPVRTTRLSQWHSFLFFNKGLRQSRSEALKHEADYNLELMAHAMDWPKPWGQAPVLQLKVPAAQTLDQAVALPAAAFFIVHPGMFGSALNWPEENYSELVAALLEKYPKHHVLITGTLDDEPFLKILKERWSHHDRVRFVQGKWNLSQLLRGLSKAEAVFAPSTGVLHLAASLGVPSIGFYSPVLVHRALRWGPRGARVLAMTPAVTCPGTLKCLGEKCLSHPCMKEIFVLDVLRQTEDLLKGKTL